VLAVLVLAACTDAFTPSVAPTTGSASLQPTATLASGGPTASSTATASPEVATPGVTSPPPSETAGASQAAIACSGNDNNRVFFAKAAAAMTWAVYCAVLPAGWFLENGTYTLADGGELEVSYNGPGDAHIAFDEGNVCDQVGSDINVCAPRDAVIGTAPFGDRTGQLGQLSNSLVLDVDRGANPSWRVTGLGLNEVDFRAICTAMLRVVAGT
jgi:hypothetical protein